MLVSFEGEEPVAVRRPNLLGAILIKARVVVRKRPEKYGSDRQDLIRLLTYVDDPRTLAADMSRKEPGWLRDAEPALGLGDPGLPVLLPIGVVQRAQQVLQLLARGSSYSESSMK